MAHCGEGWAQQRKFAHTTLREMGFGKVVMEPIIQEEVEDTIKQFRVCRSSKSWAENQKGVNAVIDDVPMRTKRALSP